ncbi:MAG: hypothetical protein R2731_05975 [Nocardioides sp.]
MPTHRPARPHRPQRARSRWLRSLALLVTASLALALPAPSAQAAQIILSTNGDNTAYGEAGGFVRFPSRYKVKIVDGWVVDKCFDPGDGRGIYMYATVFVRTPRGRWIPKRLGEIGADSNGGCPEVNVDVPTVIRDYSAKAWQVRYITVWICEEDRDKSHQCLAKHSKTYYNPHLY